MSYSTGKSAVITGAGSGIGRALARQLNSEGCTLFLSDIDEAGLAATVAGLARPEMAAHQQLLDVADKTAMDSWAETIREARGSVDIVVNNAGVALSARVDEGRYEDIQWLMGINFWGVVHGTTAFLPLLKAAPTAHLVNISSIFGMIGVPTQSAYNASKFAVRGYTDALRLEMADSNVHVCCVHPGGVGTNIARRGRGGPADMSEEERGAAFDQYVRTTAESAAAQIVTAIERRKPRLVIGSDARFINLVSRLFPVSYPRLLSGLGAIGRDEQA
ncbi:short-chain dehydrogenase [Kineobactrum sediminis]|uniref:Short-chain dehydrogenase n=1 Tax=Kineobactrum sediminis TaxID=1905677 RepID=A0A2N5Y6D1_9GAMM|nr:SDR family NAD(P)-dependent oxidoreductase [Kineobactrum sediminis]PLW83931.1 short-chain dehydrogenase [Kineobactrum sediminis]